MVTMHRKITLALGALLFALPAAATDWKRGDRIEIQSVQQVIDGDTIRTTIRGDQVNIRFHGIDAPEHDQRCGSVACGPLATQHLVELIGGIPTACPSNRMHGFCLRSARPVTCTVTDIDRKWNRPVAICEAGPTILNQRMVADGYAFAAYSDEYIPLFSLARQNRRGLHAQGALSEHDSPAAYRKTR
jgi:endonuclease YncB( thermonuclease family)